MIVRTIRSAVTLVAAGIIFYRWSPWAALFFLAIMSFVDLCNRSAVPPTTPDGENTA